MLPPANYYFLHQELCCFVCLKPVKKLHSVPLTPFLRPFPNTLRRFFFVLSLKSTGWSKEQPVFKCVLWINTWNNPLGRMLIYIYTCTNWWGFAHKVLIKVLAGPLLPVNWEVIDSDHHKTPDKRCHQILLWWFFGFKKVTLPNPHCVWAQQGGSNVSSK